MTNEKPKAYKYIGNSFSYQLMEFAKSIDIFNEDYFDSIKKSIVQYLDKNFKIKVIGHLIPDHIPWGDEGLVSGLDTTDWMNGGRKWGYPIKKKGRNGKESVYYGQVAYAFGEKKDLWIVSGDPGNAVLQENGKYKNLFDLSLSDDLPNFEPSNEDLKIRTSVIFSLKKDKDKPPIGIVNFESTERLRYLDVNIKELRTIAEAIDILYRSIEWYKSTSKATKSRVEEITKLSEFSFWGTERCVFFSYPNDCEKDLVKIVDDFFNSEYCKDKGISLITWKDIRKGRYVMDEIWEKIDNCQAGICYFSDICQNEPGEKHEIKKYIDNLNVLYEAGMMHALYETREIYLKNG